MQPQNVLQLTNRNCDWFEMKMEAPRTKVKNIEIQNMIYSVRGKWVMLDSDLAELYYLETRVFNQAVRRNINRFPEHFRFQLTEPEYKNLRSKFCDLK